MLYDAIKPAKNFTSRKTPSDFTKISIWSPNFCSTVLEFRSKAIVLKFHWNWVWSKIDHMEKEKNLEEKEEEEAIELVLFQVSECYVYLVISFSFWILLLEWWEGLYNYFN